MSNFTIINGSNIPVNVQTGTVPNMGDGLSDWFQLMTFTRVVKTTIAYQLVETRTDISFWGIVQPLTGRELLIKPEGERKWNWISVIAQAAPGQAALKLSPDEVIIFLGTQYRVMGQKNYSEYGYIYYDLVEDYTGSLG